MRALLTKYWSKYKKTLWFKISLLFSLVVIPIIVVVITKDIRISFISGFAVLLLIVSYRQRILKKL